MAGRRLPLSHGTALTQVTERSWLSAILPMGWRMALGQNDGGGALSSTMAMST